MRWIAILSIGVLVGCNAPQSNPVKTQPPGVAELLYASDQSVAGKTLEHIARAREIVLQNIASAEKPGYKRITARQAADGSAQVTLDLEQGALENTSRPLDVGISGQGFFRVRLPNGESGYTRNGNFFVNNRNELVLGIGDGLLVEPPIVIPADTKEITISQSGQFDVLRAGQPTKESMGVIHIYSFASPEQLDCQPGSAIHTATPAAGDAIECTPGENGSGLLLQGFLEKSNVNIDREKQRLQFLDEWKSALLTR